MSLDRRAQLAHGSPALAGATLAESPRAAPPELVMQNAASLATLIRDHQVSCVEVMTAHLDQIDRLNPKVNAIVSLQPREGLLAQAAERDRQLAAGQHLGWLHGMPLAVKDLAQTKGIVTTFGSPLLRDFVPTVDAIVVERMKAAGGIVIGKTNTPEWGLGSQTYNEVFGTTLNAYDQGRTAGGSSGGAAVALALRLVPVADGSDMAGSLRNPAAFNNVFGFRPSAGRVPYGPALELFMQQLGYEGPMARSVQDLALLLAVQAGPDPRAPLSLEQDPRVFAGPLERNLAGLRVGWLGDLGGYLPIEPGVLELCGDGLAVLQTLGCPVEAAVPDYPPEQVWDTWRKLRHFLVGGALRPLHRDPAKRALLKPEAVWEVEGLERLSAADVYAATTARSAWYAALRRLFARFDYLALPTAQVFPFDAALHWPREVAGRGMDTYHRWMEVVVGVTLAGLPAISVPVGFDPRGLPMGMQLVGRHHDDLGLLQLAHAYDAATQWPAKRPPALLTAG